MGAKLRSSPCTKSNDGLLKNVYIAAPCDVKWDSMHGDERVRMCGGCAKNVYNLSAMSSGEAESFLQENGVSQCMIFFRRSDGTIITDNCPVGLRKLRDNCRKVTGLVAGFMAVILSAPLAFAQRGMNDRPRDPAPPGKHWSPNPAGGGFILRDGPDVMPMRPGRMVAVPPGNRPVQPTIRPIGVKPTPLEPPKIQVKNYPPSTTKVPPVSKANPVSKAGPGAERTDKQAVTFFEKGQVAERNGETKLAEFFYEKALDFFDMQTHGDAHFRVVINNSLQKVRKQLQNNTN